MTGQAEPSNLQRGVLQVVLIYAAFATLWILSSDWLVASFVSDPAKLLRINVAKGWVFVSVTSLLLFGLLRRLVSRLAAANKRERTIQKQKDHANRLLRHRHEELAALMDGLPIPVFIAQDADCRKITGNRAANALFGVAAGTNVSASADDPPANVAYQVFDAQDGRELSPAELPMQRAARSGQAIADEEYYLRLADGRTKWWLCNAIPLFNADGQVRGAVGVFTDITERKEAQRTLEAYKDQLESTVAARTAALTRANEQLKAFTYAASHDLKTPLRGIRSFSTLLARSCSERLTDEESRFLHHIQSSAARMGILIDDLLAYAREEQADLIVSAIDLTSAVSQILRERREDIRQSAFQVRVNLPAIQVQADPAGFAQVLRNIIDNALKYAAQAETPILEIGAEVTAGRCRIWFRDNGIGFDMAHQQKIFEIFQRLHAYSDIPGSGVGLALVKKAMERMHGRVWADSTPGHGATFHLELPVADSVAPETLTRAHSS